MHVLLPYNTLFLCEGCLTFPVAVKCYLHLLIWRLFLSRGWTEFAVLFSAHSSSEHTAWPFPARCHRHASPPLQNKEKKLYIYILCITNQINVGDIESVTPGVLVKWLFKEKTEKKIPWPNPALQKSSSQFSTASLSSQHSTSVLDITKGTAG